MRFLLFDRITRLDKGKSAAGTKSFSLGDEFLRKHFRRVPYVPGVMLIEAMAQLLGWLIIYSHDFRLTTFMSLIEDVTLASRLRPGLQAEIYGEIISTSDRDSLGKTRLLVDGVEVAAIGRIIYGHSPRVNSAELRQLFCYYSGIDPAHL
jgi:3-hydroxyacyl-[acyl-carrier-protein] dehydratase